jgi:hypothetical protein
MTHDHIHLPPMPKPEDFGITAEDWKRGEVDNVRAYKKALSVWKEVALAAAGRAQ